MIKHSITKLEKRYTFFRKYGMILNTKIFKTGCICCLSKNIKFIGVKFMATTKEYRDFVLEQLGLLNDVTCRAMMGEYLLYYNGILFGGIYDNQVLIKRVESNKKYNMPEQIPYKGAKPMYLIEDIENREMVKEVVIETCKDLPTKR